MTGDGEPTSVRAIRIETIALQISVSEAYILLAGNTKDAAQSRIFKRRACVAHEEAASLLKLTALPEPEASMFRDELRSLETRLKAMPPK